MKKILSILFVVAILLGVCCVSPLSVGAKTSDTAITSATYGDYEYEIIDKSTVTIVRYQGNDKNITIPSKIKNYPVTVLDFGSFSDCSAKSIVIPDTVQFIGMGAFTYCPNLESITIPDSVLRIGDDAFRDCEKLKSIHIPSSVTFIGLNMMGGCYNLEKITVDPNNKNYNSGDNYNAVISNSTNALIIGCKSTVIPEGVSSIHPYAFQGCGIKNVTLPSSVTMIGEGAFSGCSQLASIDIPDSVTEIGMSAFNCCDSLKQVTIPNSITKINDYTFSTCFTLESVTIPSSVTEIGSNAFYSCPNLKNVNIPDSVTTIGEGAFCCCLNLKEITLPDSVTNLAAGAFEMCEGMEKITILNPQCTIEESKWMKTIPSTITIYGYENSTAQTYAEKNSNNFVVVTEKPDTPSQPETVFGDTDLDGVVSVMDATEIQLVLALTKSWVSEDANANADFDKDGVVSVMDATEIQLVLAGLR